MKNDPERVPATEILTLAAPETVLRDNNPAAKDAGGFVRSDEFLALISVKQRADRSAAVGIEINSDGRLLKLRETDSRSARCAVPA